MGECQVSAVKGVHTVYTVLAGYAADMVLSVGCQGSSGVILAHGGLCNFSTQN